MNYVDISASKDGAHTYSDPRKVPMGETGDFLFPVVTRRWGSARHWVFRFRVTDNCRANLIAGAIQTEPAGP